MKKYLMLVFMASISFFIEASAEPQQTWEVKDVGSIAIFDWASPLDLNDNGQVLLMSRNNYKDIWAIGNAECPAVILPELPKPTSSGINTSAILWQKINRSDVVIGTRRVFNSKLNQLTHELITWKASEGLKKYEIKHCKIPSPDPKVAQCGNSNHVVLTCEDNIYELSENILIDLSPIILNDLAKIGFKFHKIILSAFAVNDNGTIYGKFECFEKHPYKEKPVFIEAHYFLWDYDNTYIIDIPKNVIVNISDSFQHLNNNNHVLLNLYSNSIHISPSWIWNKENGLISLIPPFDYPYSQNYVIAELDDGTQVWSIHSAGGGTVYDLFFHNDSKNSLLKSFDHIYTENINHSKYCSLKSQGFKTGLVNNKKQVVFIGNFMNENHPFLLTLD